MTLFRTLPLAAAALLALTAAPSSAQAVGSRLPDVEVFDLAQTGATSVADFTGRAVLYEFFAYW